jgi:hypothetical protein
MKAMIDPRYGQQPEKRRHNRRSCQREALLMIEIAALNGAANFFEIFITFPAPRFCIASRVFEAIPTTHYSQFKEAIRKHELPPQGVKTVSEERRPRLDESVAELSESDIWGAS